MKPSQKIGKDSGGKSYKCMSCGIDVNDDNFGIISEDLQSCDKSLCRIEMLDKLKESKKHSSLTSSPVEAD